MLLKYYYFFDNSKHILVNNSQPLNYLKIKYEDELLAPIISDQVMSNLKIKLKERGIAVRKQPKE